MVEAPPPPVEMPKPPKEPEKVKPKPSQLAKATPLSKPKPPKPPKPLRDFAQILKDLPPEKSQVAQKSAAPKDEGKQTPTPQQISDAPSITEIERLKQMIRQQIEPCWSPPVGAAGAEELAVTIFIRVDQRGFVSEARVLNAGAMSRNKFVQAAADAARRAVLNPRCQPFQLPQKRYDLWKEIRFNFDPREMLGLVMLSYTMKLRRRATFLLTIITALALPTVALAQLEIKLTEGNIKPLPIAVPDFIAQSPQAQQIAVDIATVVSRDLERSGLFAPIDKRAFLSRPAALAVRPNFVNWKPLSAQALIIGEARISADGQLSADFRLWDVFAEQPMTGLSLTTTPSNWRRIAHLIADAVYERITGERGYFDTRIVYISETGPLERRIKRLSIMDQDGANHRFLSDGDELVLTPRFSPTQQEITYLAYFNNQPRVYLFNIDTGEQEVLGDFPA